MNRPVNRRTALALGAAATALFAAPEQVWGQGADADAGAGALKLWYRGPAELWTEALPIGMRSG